MSLVLVGPGARPLGYRNRALVPGTPEPDAPDKPTAEPATIKAVPLGYTRRICARAGQVSL